MQYPNKIRDYMPGYMLCRRDYTIVIALGYYMLNYKQSIV